MVFIEPTLRILGGHHEMIDLRKYLA